MGLLDGKTAIVTGAARGIGKAIALKFAQEGANIAFTDLVIDENAEATAKELEALGVKAKAYASNAANFEDTANVVAEIHKDFGRIDILVNNAGITRDGLMMRMSEQQWDMVINVNLKSAFNFIHACTPIMMRQKAGRHYQYGICGRCSRQCRPGQLFCFQSRYDCFGQVYRSGAGFSWNPCQCHCSGLHHDSHDRRLV